MAARALNISGMDEVKQELAEAQQRICTAVVRAMEAGIAVMEAEVYKKTPVGVVTKAGKRHLRDAIVHVIKSDPAFRFVLGEIGFGSEDYKAFWLEYGFKLTGHLPDKTPIKDIPPHPVLRPAFDASKDAAVQAFMDVLEREMKAIYG